ncbi:MAG: AI-2E family transporter [Pseudomonadota bacterium]
MKFLAVIGDWLNEHFSNEEAIYLVILITVILLVLATLGTYLAPVITGLVLAFLLQGLVATLERRRVPHVAAVFITFVLFVSVLLALALILLPLLWQQLTELLQAVPNIVARLRDTLQALTERFPEYITPEQVSAVMDQGTRELGALSAAVVETAFSQATSVFGLIIYIVLVPVTVFFFLKDKDQLLEFWASLLPSNRPLLDAVGTEMTDQLGNYVRGKVIEILLVGAATFVAFVLLGLNYAALLGVLVGLSVIIPFVGAALVTIPVVAVAMFQFGWSLEMAWVVIVYAIIQFIDGNLLVPLLFSEVVDLHPVTIIIAVLAFGGLWGIWGVFFAIPLATLIKAIYKAWPRSEPVEMAG